MKTLAQGILKQLLDYNLVTGDLIWKVKRGKGVYPYARDNIWIAQIGIVIKRFILGRSHCKDEVICLRYAAEQCLNWNGCNISSPAYKYVRDNIQ